MEIGQEHGGHRRDWQVALVIGAEKLSAWLDWTDRNTCVLFGDGGGACVFGSSNRRDRPGRGILSPHSWAVTVNTPRSSHFTGERGTRCPITKDNVDQRLQTLKMLGKETFKQAVNAMTSASLEVLDRTGLTVEDIACIIPHQANFRIIDAIADPAQRAHLTVFSSISTVTATPGPLPWPSRLDEANRAGRIKPGDKVLLIVFGSGLTWASTVIDGRRGRAYHEPGLALKNDYVRRRHRTRPSPGCNVSAR